MFRSNPEFDWKKSWQKMYNECIGLKFVRQLARTTTKVRSSKKLYDSVGSILGLYGRFVVAVVDRGGWESLLVI